MPSAPLPCPHMPLIGLPGPCGRAANGQEMRTAGVAGEAVHRLPPVVHLHPYPARPPARPGGGARACAARSADRRDGLNITSETMGA